MVGKTKRNTRSTGNAPKPVFTETDAAPVVEEVVEVPTEEPKQQKQPKVSKKAAAASVEKPAEAVETSKKAPVEPSEAEKVVLEKIAELKAALAEFKNSGEKLTTLISAYGETLTQVRELAGDSRKAVTELHNAMDTGAVNYAVAKIQAKTEKKQRKSSKSTTSRVTLYSMSNDFSEVVAIPEIAAMLEENGIKPEDGYLPAMSFNSAIWKIANHYEMKPNGKISWNGRNDLPEELLSLLNLKLGNSSFHQTETLNFKEVSAFVSLFCKGKDVKTMTVEKKTEETTSD